MGRPNENKGSTPKIPPTSAEQDKVRRAAKASRRRKGMGLHQETMMGGMAADRLKAYAVLLMDELDTRMVSSGRTAHITLRAQLQVLMEAFMNVSNEQLRQRQMRRIDFALNQAVRELADGPLKNYFISTARNANRKVVDQLKSAA